MSGEAEPPATLGLPRSRERALTVHANAIALFLNVVVSAGFGYLSWLIAARFVAPDVVGLAAAVVSAALLCGNLAILGLGITVITFLPRELRDPAALLNAFFTIVLLGAGLCGLGFVLVAAAFLEHLRVLGSNVTLGASFVVLATGTSVVILLDGTSIALRRGDYAVIRSTVAGVAKMLVVICVWLVAGLSAGALVAAWSLATLSACLLGYRQLRSRFPEYRYTPRISLTWGKVAFRTGLSNHILNLSRLVPTLTIPLVVTELLSPSENGYWYACWMIAFLVRFVPGATAEATLAEISNRSASLAGGVWRSMWSSVAVSLLAMIGLIVIAHPILRLMGDQYARAGTTPLRVLALSIVPQIFIEFYILTRRVTMRLVEPNIVFAVTAVASIAAAAYGGHAHGLIGVAAGWLIVESVAAVWAATRLIGSFRAATDDAVFNDP